MCQDLKCEEYIEKLKNSKNIILRGAPGTGKTHLAKDIATYLFAGKKYDELVPAKEPENTPEDPKIAEAKSHIGFVQFHPSYDYTDFVEGLRPVQKEGSNNNEIGFALRAGVFKTFCKNAKEHEDDFRTAVQSQNDEEVKKAYENAYIFIIDEINRGEISKIFGELFYSIDPGYRGKTGEVLTQYSNLHNKNEPEKFYVPENVFIIGTMNDIDRSVEPFDFAMRRRFRFIEIKPEDTQQAILASMDPKKQPEAINKMNELNNKIRDNSDLGPNYQIGAAYFAKLEEVNYNYKELWEEYLKPLLSDYLQGTGDTATVNNVLEDYKNTL